jgi:cysteine desulfurase
MKKAVFRVFGKFTTKEEVEKASSAIASAVKAILSLK